MKHSTLAIAAIMCFAACKKDGTGSPGTTPSLPVTSGRTTSFSSVPSTRDSVVFGINGSLRVQFAKDSVNTDNIVINFNPSSSTKYNYLEDAPYFGGFGQESLSSLSSDNVALAINSFPLVKNTNVIKLKTGAKQDGNYKLKLTSVSSLPQIFDVWLVDAYKKDSVDFRAAPSYPVDVKLADNTTYGASRFKLIISENASRAVHFSDFEAAKDSTGVTLGWHTINEFDYTRFAVQRSTDKFQTFTSLNSMASTGLGNYGFTDKKPVAGTYQYRLKVYDINGNIMYSDPLSITY